MGYLVRLRGDGFKATNQQETDRYWNAIVRNGGRESQCGWWALSD